MKLAKVMPSWFRSEIDARFPGEIAVPPIEGTYLAWLDFGGTGLSGHGREKGFEALHGFSALKTVAAKHG